ncbi:MAG: 16S rRNA (uracil(1498)-N(3))-methyltransferase [Desulfobulbaceae bacterium]
MRRFFVDPEAISDDLAILSPEESRHIATVLRLRSGTPVELFDTTGFVYQGLILTISPRKVTVEILSRYSAARDGAPRLILLQSLLKGKKMDFLVQKATELGVHAFRPVLTRYSENRGNPKRQHERWRRIMLEACKQCRRTRPMRIEEVVPFADLDLAEYRKTILPWEEEKTTRLDAGHIDYEGSTAILVGPEGGFHTEEVEQALSRGAVAVSLGSRILRAETAALTCVAILQFLGGGLAPEKN